MLSAEDVMQLMLSEMMYAAIAVSSNLQGAATLVGDTTAIMLGSALDMSFMDFFWYHGRPGMFFAVELGAVLSAIILTFLFRKEKALIPKTGQRTKVQTMFLPFCWQEPLHC